MGRGHSLLELMVSLVVIGILAAVAYPGYTQHVQRGRRAQAEAALMAAAQYLQRLHVARGHYVGAELPAAYQDVDSHVLTLVVGDDEQSYLLTATPRRPDTQCGALTLADTGAKGQQGPGRVADCW